MSDKPASPPDDDLRWCRTGHYAPVAEMARDRSKPDGITTICRPCKAASSAARNRERTKAGLCLQCDAPAAPGHTRCAEHLAAARDRAAARVAEGRCQQNGCPHMAEPGRTLCAEHLSARAARRRDRADAGLCTWCGEPAEPGRSMCAEHLAAQRAYGRAARQARRADGRCQQTGCPHMAEPGRTLCAEHLAAHRASNRARIADGRHAAALRALRERYIAQGYCENGPGHGPPVAGSTKCARCRARAQARYRKTLIEFTAILADQGVDHDGRCELCGLAEATQVDHVLPRSLGGPDDDPLLLRWACRSCNASRGANTSWVPALTAWDVEEQLSREEDR